MFLYPCTGMENNNSIFLNPAILCLIRSTRENSSCSTVHCKEMDTRKLSLFIESVLFSLNRSVPL